LNTDVFSDFLFRVNGAAAFGAAMQDMPQLVELIIIGMSTALNGIAVFDILLVFDVNLFFITRSEKHSYLQTFIFSDIVILTCCFQRYPQLCRLCSSRTGPDVYAEASRA
jgi:uncharacterized membrane protein